MTMRRILGYGVAILPLAVVIGIGGLAAGWFTAAIVTVATMFIVGCGVLAARLLDD